jgi:hypothetical protein
MILTTVYREFMIDNFKLQRAARFIASGLGGENQARECHISRIGPGR